VGRSNGGLTTKIHAACIDEISSVALVLSPGQSADCSRFGELFGELSEDNVIEAAALDKGYDTNAIRDHLALEGIEAVIPPRSHRKEQFAYDKAVYRERNRVERFFNRLKHFRRIATRYEKYSRTFLAMVHLTSAFILTR
jgi:putative transposase